MTKQMFTSGGGHFAPDRSQKLNTLERSIREVFDSYGYTDLFLPIYEHYDMLKETAQNFKDENIIRFIDRNTGKSLVLRPDFTPQVCRNVANYMGDYPTPIRVSYRGRIFRNVNLDRGLKSEKYQMGCELFGVDEFLGDLELVLIANRIFENLKITGYRIVVGDIRYLKRLFELLDEKHADIYRGYLEGKKIHAIDALLKTLEIDQELKELLRFLPFAFGGEDVLVKLHELSAFDEQLASRVSHIRMLMEEAKRLGVASDVLVFDAAETRGLDYYTGLNFEILHKDSGFSIGGGGRYDNLMSKFGHDMPACGMAVHLEELMQFDVAFEGKRSYDYLVVGKEKFDTAEELRRNGHSVFLLYEEDQKEAFLSRFTVQNIL